MDTSLVSVIIPTHNRAAMLACAIRSVQRQTYNHLEILVVDDASKDNTAEVVASFGDPRIHYIRHDANRGGSASRNTGISAATGEFIAFLDDDDEWEPEKTEEQLKVIQGYDAVTCSAFPIPDNMTDISTTKVVELEDLLQGKFTWGGTGALFAKTLVLKNTMFDESLPRYQDWDLFIRIALKHKIVYLNKPLLRSNAGEHIRITNKSGKVPISDLEEHYQMLHKHESLFGPRLFKRHMSDALLFGIIHRRDKLALLAYTARHYGLGNVVRALVIRFRYKLRESISRTAVVERKDANMSESR